MPIVAYWGGSRSRKLVCLLDHVIIEYMSPSEPKRVTACLDIELSLPPVDEFHAPVADKERHFSREKTLVIRS